MLNFLTSFILGFAAAAAILAVAAGLWGAAFLKRLARARRSCAALRDRRPIRFEDAPFFNPANIYEGHDYDQV